MGIDQPDPREDRRGEPETAREGRDQPESGEGPEEPDRAVGPEDQALAARSEVEAMAAGPRERVAAQVRYRETVTARYRETANVLGQETAEARPPRSADAASRAAADRWNQAVPQLRAAWEEHKDRYPERTRASSRTEADGTWTCGEHRRLDPEQNAEAGQAHADLADEADRHILPALRRIEAADPGRRLAGLEHMVKGEDRLKEKLADAWHGRPGLTAGQVLGMVPDAVRSTLMYRSEDYAEGVLADVGQLRAEGFDLIKLKNLWHADQYKGINSQWRRAETGTRFEMQFHTPESLAAKELTHEAYERIRANAALPVDEQDLAQERELDNFQRRVNALIATPPGTERIKDFPEQNDG